MLSLPLFVVVVPSTQQELEAALAAETATWPSDVGTARAVLLAVFCLVREAAGDLLIVVGPRETLLPLQDKCSHVDGDYLTRRLHKARVTDPRFQPCDGGNVSTRHGSPSSRPFR